MTDDRQVEQEITLDDIKHKAEGVRDLAVSQAKDAAREVVEQDWTRLLIIAGVGLGLLLSFAYYMGSRAGKATEYDAPEDFGRAYD